MRAAVTLVELTGGHVDVGTRTVVVDNQDVIRAFPTTGSAISTRSMVKVHESVRLARSVADTGDLQVLLKHIESGINKTRW